MKLQAIISQARSLVDDVTEDDNPRQVANPLHSDTELKGYASEAEREAAMRGLLIWDNVTPDVCVIELSAEELTYPLSPKLLLIEDLAINDASLCAGSYSIRGAGNKREITLKYAPTEGSELRLTVYRLPLNDLTNLEDDEPEIPYYAHDKLAHWVAYRVYLQSDLDTASRDAAEQLALFERHFGPARSISDVARHLQHGVNQSVVMQGALA